MKLGGRNMSEVPENLVFVDQKNSALPPESRHLMAQSFDFAAIKAHNVAEFLGNPDQKFSVPLADVLKSPEAVATLWPHLADDLVPQVEQHQESSSKVTSYLDNYFYGRGNLEDLASDREAYYSGASELLDNPETRRIALFLPFETFPNSEDHSAAAEQFRANYLSAWQDLLFVKDVRANFVDGNIVEDGSAAHAPERVVKAAHLAPWLVSHDMISIETITDLIDQEQDELLTHSFAETFPLMDRMGLLNDENRSKLQSITDALPERAESSGLSYISLARKIWQSGQQAHAKRPSNFTPELYTLGLPAASRIPSLSSEILASEQLTHRLDPTTSGVVLLGGARLKGYGRPDSKLELYIVTDERTLSAPAGHALNIEEVKSDPAAHAHKLFDMLSVGAPDDIARVQRELAPLYFAQRDSHIRQWITEKLEQDLLEYRLLHEGYARSCPDTNPELKEFTDMDGESAFYETGYRVIATKIYAESIYVPKL